MVITTNCVNEKALVYFLIRIVVIYYLLSYSKNVKNVFRLKRVLGAIRFLVFYSRLVLQKAYGGGGIVGFG